MVEEVGHLQGHQEEGVEELRPLEGVGSRPREEEEFHPSEDQGVGEVGQAFPSVLVEVREGETAESASFPCFARDCWLGLASWPPTERDVRYYHFCSARAESWPQERYRFETDLRQIYYPSSSA